MATTIVQSGSYDLTIATGFLVDAFTLDDPVKGLLDSTEYVLDGTTEFASVNEVAPNNWYRTWSGFGNDAPVPVNQPVLIPLAPLKIATS